MLAGLTNDNYSIGNLLPERIGAHIVDPELRNEVNQISNNENRQLYLSKILTNQGSGKEVENRRVASAIRLLGTLRKTNSVDLISDFITFEEIETRSYPAVYAITNMGEASVPVLLKITMSSTNEMAIANSVKSLMLIKGTNYLDFAVTQKNNFPASEWKRLLRYAIRE